jgi:hypothetical protein
LNRYDKAITILAMGSVNDPASPASLDLAAPASAASLDLAAPASTASLASTASSAPTAPTAPHGRRCGKAITITALGLRNAFTGSAPHPHGFNRLLA